MRGRSPASERDNSILQIALLGLGTVGSGVLKLLQENRALIERQAGVKLVVRHILVRDLHKPRQVAIPAGVLTTEGARIVDDPAVDIVLELMGGLEPARSLIVRALQNGKQVITANKELMAKEGHALLTLAQERGLDLLFEASVAAGIPILHHLKTTLAANRIHQVVGIVNGTANFILTRMSDSLVAYQGQDAYQQALAEAQRAGYAEPDPSADVEGYDAQYKMAILAAVAFTNRVPLQAVYREGMTHLSLRDLRWAQELGYRVKLLGIARRGEDNTLSVRVHPTFVPMHHPLAWVNEANNAIWLQGDGFGEMMFYGAGAGSLPTASAVLGDLIETARNIRLGSTGRIGCTCFEHRPIQPIEQASNRYYLRVIACDPLKTLAEIAATFSQFNIGVERVLQATHHEGTCPEDAFAERPSETVWLTYPTEEAHFRNALDQIAILSSVKSIANWVRILD